MKKEKKRDNSMLVGLLNSPLDVLIGNISATECTKKSLPQILIDLKYSTNREDVTRAKKLVKQVINDMTLLHNELKQIVDDY